MREPSAVRELRGFMFDMDGVIYRGSEVLPGAAALIGNLRRSGMPFLFLTNNSTTPPARVAERLTAMGIPAAGRDILTSAEVTAAVLAHEQPHCRVYLVGEAGIREALLAAGCALVEDYRDADAVVVGMDRQATYARLRDAALAIRRGALFIATNSDRALPTEEGLIPGAGSLVGMLEIATDAQARVIGKPSPAIFDAALDRLGSPRQLTAIIGDRPETDIAGGQASGLRTVAVLTGIGSAADFAAMQPPPDWVFDDLAGLNAAYFG